MWSLFSFSRHLYLTPENEQQKDMCYGEIGQYVQNINTRYCGFNSKHHNWEGLGDDLEKEHLHLVDLL
jgi:hypothetical protein